MQNVYILKFIQNLPCKKFEILVDRGFKFHNVFLYCHNFQSFSHRLCCHWLTYKDHPDASNQMEVNTLWTNKQKSQSKIFWRGEPPF